MMLQRAAVLLAVLISLCASVKSFAAPNIQQLPRKIGVVAPLTGPLAEYGVATRNGIALAKDAMPEQFKDIEFIYEDSAYDPKTALAAFNKLRTLDNVSLVVDWGAQTSQAIAPVAERSKFPFISMSIEPAVSAGRQYVVRFHSDANQYARTIVDYLVAHKVQKIALVKSEIVYFNKILAGLRQQLPKSVTLDVIAELSPSQTDFKVEISKIRAQSYDMVGVFLVAGQISQFYKQMHAQRVSLPTFGSDFFDSPSEIAAANNLMEGAVFPEYGFTESFRVEYEKHVKNASQLPYAALAYDFAVHIAKALAKSDRDASGILLVDAFTNLSKNRGVTGDYVFENTAEGGKSFKFPFVLRQIRNGEVRMVEQRSGG